jgi:hypothetical protein
MSAREDAAERRVAVDDPAFAVDEDDSDRCRLEKGLVALLVHCHAAVR